MRLARFKRPAQTQVARHPRERAATDQVNERRCEQRRLRRAVRIVRRRPTMPSEASERARGPHRDAEDHARRLASRSRTTAARSRPASHATAHRGTAGEAQPLTVARAAGRATSWSSTRPRHASTGAPARHATSHNAPGRKPRSPVAPSTPSRPSPWRDPRGARSTAAAPDAHAAGAVDSPAAPDRSPHARDHRTSSTTQGSVDARLPFHIARQPPASTKDHMTLQDRAPDIDTLRDGTHRVLTRRVICRHRRASPRSRLSGVRRGGPGASRVQPRCSPLASELPRELTKTPSTRKPGRRRPKHRPSSGLSAATPDAVSMKTQKHPATASSAYRGATTDPPRVAGVRSARSA